MECWRRSRLPTRTSLGFRDISTPSLAFRSTDRCPRLSLLLLEREDWQEFDRMQNAIREQLQLAYPDGREVPEFRLHVNGDEAWFRWDDESFDSE
jgi:hypothetical protein